MMLYLTVGFLMLSLPIWIIGSAIIEVCLESKGEPKDGRSVAFTSALLFVTSWWGLYFLIRAAWS